MGSEPRFLILGVPQPLAWAVSVRNSPVVEVEALPPESYVGSYCVVYASGSYASEAAGRMNHLGVGAPQPGVEPEEGVVAIGRIRHIGQPVSTLPGKRWCQSGAGVWFQGVFPVEEGLFTHPVAPGAWAELDGGHALAARQAYREAVAGMMGLVAFTAEERARMPIHVRAERVEATLAHARRCNAAEFDAHLRRIVTG